jgi:Co/Zn/Cd efflux system component
MDAAMGIVGAVVIGRWSWSLMRDTAAVLVDAVATIRWRTKFGKPLRMGTRE